MTTTNKTTNNAPRRLSSIPAATSGRISAIGAIGLIVVATAYMNTTSMKPTDTQTANCARPICTSR